MCGVHVTVDRSTGLSTFFVSSRAITRLPGSATFRYWKSVALFLTLAASLSTAGTEQTVDELKSRVSAANVGDKARLCVQIAEKQLTAADKQFSADELEKAQASLADVVAYSELARDYSIQAHKHQKQTEIAVRTMTRKLNEIWHVVGREDQVSVKEAINRLERVRDDLLAAMFPKGAK